ncbi:hypothetical protein J3T78_04635 [Staphylococcus nepalensis]|uniref:Uncharacterized protein n=1 Tax=Staphylococcus nepalensis TaxID=214473 RepID=A0ABS3L3G3_9STAP|nr:hypothetical protein [Staphylococcus nepalensis]MBO1213786.1 hypothetical protein [Staphylococcus nepalensis]MBO1214993.1 hypothetical protein [Staphylococcus nepalensis]MBO1226949.1 hypothetical protein [Staphylococcus nepalensis]MBO1234063.1 hypothetical protein [Staphylococcus nepalensis]MBO1236995.1 hypothetical protein [Staphylococcus nepalensis]
MNITITILSCFLLYLVATKIMQRSEIKRLKYRLDYKHKKVNELIVDSTNKIIVLHLENGTISPGQLEKIRNDFQGFEEKGYYLIVLDKTFDVNQKQLSIELATKLKHELNKEDE